MKDQINKPEEVPEGVNREGEREELRMRLGAEICVWSDRMLDALVKGVEGGKWFSLKDKLYRRRTLEVAACKVCAKGASAGVDAQSASRFEQDMQRQITLLERQLRNGSYRPHPVKRVYIPKPGSSEKRPLGIPAVRDRVVQKALLMVIGPIFEIGFSENSHGFRPRRGCKTALREVDTLLKDGHHWIVDADLKSYFDTIDHNRLMVRIREKVADGLCLDLIEGYLKQGVLTTCGNWEASLDGTPQGAVISPLLSNLYLNELDHMIARQGHRIVRYADDFVILCRSEAEAGRALELVREWTTANALTLHPQKTRVSTLAEGFEFLGYRFVTGRNGHLRRYVRGKSMKSMRSKLAPLLKRTNGHSLETTLARINPKLKGWYGYYKHAHPSSLISMDGWVRMRLRSMLRKRLRKKGRGRGSDHQKWPVAYFDKMGLFNLKQARRELIQSQQY